MSILAVVPPLSAQTGSGGSAAGRLDPWVSRAFDSALVPGVAVAVVRGDSVVYLRGFGMANREGSRHVTPETVFYIASATKSFFGMAAALLHSRGTINLDDPVSRYLPSLQLAAPLIADSISLRALLTHTHGLDGNGGGVVLRTAYTGVWNHEQLLALLASAAPARNGRAFGYSNIGYNVGSLALEEYLKTSWKEVLEWELFRPLGMRSTTGYVSRVDPTRLAAPYRLGPDGPERVAFGKNDATMHAAGGLVTTAADLSRWMLVNLNTGRVEGAQLLPADAVELAQRPTATAEGAFDEFSRTGYSLGLYHGEYAGHRQFHHFGGFSGYHAHISYLPGSRLGVAVLINDAEAGGVVATTIAKGIYDILLERPDLAARQEALLAAQQTMGARATGAVRADRARRAGRSQTLPRPLEAYAGIFEHPMAGRLEWRVADDRLYARIGVAESVAEVFDATQDQLRVELTGSGAVAAFVFEGDLAVRVNMMGLSFTRLDPERR